MKFKHSVLICIAGVVWLVIGIALLSLGIHFILESLHIHYAAQNGKFSIISCLNNYITDRTQAVVLIMTLALFLGYFKGKMVLVKSVHRQIKRIDGLSNPASLSSLYSKGYYLLVALMIALGISLKYLPITLDTRGAIDITIGSALINGAMLYFRTLATRLYLKKKGSLKI